MDLLSQIQPWLVPLLALVAVWLLRRYLNVTVDQTKVENLLAAIMCSVFQRKTAFADRYATAI